mmetsp:Transcript_24155/g.48002  ORF Transcript_24155/g.48002 Transcript_24155/m.48002 type:complete len:227 (-) Transcript_24155:229-909(-)
MNVIEDLSLHQLPTPLSSFQSPPKFFFQSSTDILEPFAVDAEIGLSDPARAPDVELSRCGIVPTLEVVDEPLLVALKLHVQIIIRGIVLHDLEPSPVYTPLTQLIGIDDLSDVPHRLTAVGGRPGGQVPGRRIVQRGRRTPAVQRPIIAWFQSKIRSPGSRISFGETQIGRLGARIGNDVGVPGIQAIGKGIGGKIDSRRCGEQCQGRGYKGSSVAAFSDDVLVSI